jgi:glycosyltransferase involved in cell wall biosynthesis
LNQTHSDWDLRIVDDGSTDNTKQVVEDFNDPRIRFIEQNHQGCAAARNTALQYATGEWIAYIDSDNELLPDYLTEMLRAASKHPTAKYILDKPKRTLELYEDGKLIESIDDSSDVSDSLTVRDICHRTMHFDINGFMHHRQIIDDGVRFDAAFHGFSLEDWDFVLQIIERYPEDFLYLPKVLHNYHQRFGTDGMVSNTSYRGWIKSFEIVYQKHKNDKMVQGQTWYPNRIKKYEKLEADFHKGIAPPSSLYYFPGQHKTA